MARETVRYTPAIAAEVLQRLEDGETLRAVCRDEAMPSLGMVQRWIAADRSGFASRYARAREIGYRHMADEILEISDDCERDILESGYNAEAVARSRLRVDTRKWLLAKAMPKIYGDKVALTDAAGTGPVEVVHKLAWGDGSTATLQAPGAPVIEHEPDGGADAD